MRFLSSSSLEGEQMETCALISLPVPPPLFSEAVSRVITCIGEDGQCGGAESMISESAKMGNKE